MPRSRKAIALSYKPPKDAAPVIVAKGAGEIAERIIALAREHNIPLKEDRQLVEILSALDVQQEIPPDLYKAVAEILAWVYRLTGKVPEEEKL